MKRFSYSLLILVSLAFGGGAAQKAIPSTKGKARLKIEILYFESCPSYKKAILNVKAALKEENIQADLRLIEVATAEKAEKVGFQGSPSIRINGKDMEGRDEGYSFSCRLYNVNGKPETAPSKEYIEEKLQQFR